MGRRQLLRSVLAAGMAAAAGCGGAGPPPVPAEPPAPAVETPGALPGGTPATTAPTDAKAAPPVSFAVAKKNPADQVGRTASWDGVIVGHNAQVGPDGQTRITHTVRFIDPAQSGYEPKDLFLVLPDGQRKTPEAERLYNKPGTHRYRFTGVIARKGEVQYREVNSLYTLTVPVLTDVLVDAAVPPDK